MVQLSPRGSRFMKDFGIRLPSALVQRHYPEYVKARIEDLEKILREVNGKVELEVASDLVAVKRAWEDILAAMPLPQLHFGTFCRDHGIKDPEGSPAFSVDDARWRIYEIEQACSTLGCETYVQQYSDDSRKYAQKRLTVWIRTLKDQDRRLGMEFTTEARKGRPAEQVARLAAKRAADAELRRSMQSSKKK